MNDLPHWKLLWTQAHQAKSNPHLELNRAVQLMEQALLEARSELSHADPEAYLPKLLNALASLYREVGRLDDAINAAREGLARRREGLPRIPALIGNDVMFLCLVLQAKGEIKEALALAEEGLALYSDAYGPDHGETRYVLSVRNRLRSFE